MQDAVLGLGREDIAQLAASQAWCGVTRLGRKMANPAHQACSRRLNPEPRESLLQRVPASAQGRGAGHQRRRVLGQGLQRRSGLRLLSRMQLIVWVKKWIKEICHPGLKGQSRVLQPEQEEAAGIGGVTWEADRCFLHPIHKVPCVC